MTTPNDFETPDKLSDAILAQLRARLATRYTVQQEIGRGGMAFVYLAHELKHDRDVALKVLATPISSADSAERFVREIRVLSKLQHPHLIPLFDSGRAGDWLYYTMPYVRGKSLAALLSRERELSIGQAIEIIRGAANALNHAHEQGFVHRDIKPGNILLADGQPMVADFGIARAIDNVGDERLTSYGKQMGTVLYMSPEQAEGDRQLDARTDIYSLACVLYEMLGGEPPFSGGSAQAICIRHMTAPVPSLRALRPIVPLSLDGLSKKHFPKNPQTVIKRQTSSPTPSLSRQKMNRQANVLAFLVSDDHRRSVGDRRGSADCLVGVER